LLLLVIIAPMLLQTLSAELGQEAMIKSSVDFSNQP
jgi:hypothetical protein